MPLALFLGLAATAHAADDGKTCLRGGGDPAARLEACARYISSGNARGVNLVGAYNVRASLWADRGELDRALEENTEAIRLAPGVSQIAPLHKDRGAIYWKMGDYDRALAELDEAVKLDAKLAETYYWRGLAYLSKKDYDRAIDEYTTAIKRDPKDAEFYMRRCEAYNGKGEFDKALTDCNEALRRNPKYVYGYTWRGITYQNKGELDNARADYERALSLDPKLEDTRARLLALAQGSAAQAQTDTQPAPPAAPAAEGPPPATAAEPPSSDVAAAAPTQDAAPQVLKRDGLLGIWSADCSNPPSPNNEYFVYRAIDAQRIQFDGMTGPSQRSFAYIIDSTSEAGANETTGTAQNREVFRLQVAGNRVRHLELAADGTKLVAAGRYLADYGNPALIGKETAWLAKCK